MNSKKEKKTIVGLVVSILVLLMFTITMTFAYFTANSSATSSTMTFGTLNINTDGLTAGQKSATCGSPAHTLVPGCTIDLSAPVSVSGTIDALLRAQLTATVFQTNGVDSNTEGAVNCKIENNRVVVDAANGTFYALKSEVTTTASGENLSFAQQVFNLANTASYSGWTYSDGYYYYNKVVNGTIVDNDRSFATSFTLPANTMGNDWQGAYVQFGIVLQAIQAEHLVNANNKKITFTKGVGNVITSVSVESGDTITVDVNNKTLEDVFGVINGVAAWAAVESESGEGGGGDSAPTAAELSLQYMNFVPLTEGHYHDNYNDYYYYYADEQDTTFSSLVSSNISNITGLNDVKVNNANLMTGGTKFVGVYASDELANCSQDNADEAVNLIIPSYVKIENNKVVLAGDEECENNNVYQVVRIMRFNPDLDDSIQGFSGKNIGTLTIPETIRNIDTYTFHDCDNITTLYYNAIDAVVTDFHNEFSDDDIYCITANSEGGGAIMSSIDEVIIGNLVEVIPTDLFTDYNGCEIESINFSNASSLITIGKYAFQGVEDITTLVLPSSLQTIEYKAFWYCSSLTTVVIPSSVTSIDGDAFEDCSELETIYFLGNESQWANITSGLDNEHILKTKVNYDYPNA